MARGPRRHRRRRSRRRTSLVDQFRPGRAESAASYTRDQRKGQRDPRGNRPRGARHVRRRARVSPSLARRIRGPLEGAGFSFQPGSERSTWQFVPTLAPSGAARDAVLGHAALVGVELRTYFASTAGLVAAIRHVTSAERAARHRGPVQADRVTASRQRPDGLPRSPASSNASSRDSPRRGRTVRSKRRRERLRQTMQACGAGTSRLMRTAVFGSRPDGHARVVIELLCAAPDVELIRADRRLPGERCTGDRRAHSHRDV